MPDAPRIKQLEDYLKGNSILFPLKLIYVFFVIAKITWKLFKRSMVQATITH